MKYYVETRTGKIYQIDPRSNVLLPLLSRYNFNHDDVIKTLHSKKSTSPYNSLLVLEGPKFLDSRIKMISIIQVWYEDD